MLQSWPWPSTFGGVLESSLLTCYWLFWVTGDSRKKRRPFDWSLLHHGQGKSKKQTKTDCKGDLSCSTAFPYNILLLGPWNCFWLNFKLLSSPSSSSVWVTGVYVALGWEELSDVNSGGARDRHMASIEFSTDYCILWIWLPFMLYQ